MIAETMILALVVLFGVPAVLMAIYLLTFTLLSWRPVVPLPAERRRRFDVIVPAHDEELVIARVVSSLQALDWPRECFRVIVVADNCTDTTATIARQGGAQVLERTSATERGKGYALRLAFEHSLADGFAEAVVVVDADSHVTANLLTGFAARIDQGADAMQADGAVLDPETAMRTRLMAIALGAFHRLRHRAREHLGLSAGIRGNGWCVTHRLLRELPYAAFSLAEDLEYGIEIALAGKRVFYVDEASSFAEMVPTARDSVKQRQRWEFGRIDLVRSRTLPLLRAAWRERSWVCLDQAMDLIVPPLSYVALTMAAFAGIALLGGWRVAALRWTPAWIAAACLATLVLYVLRGWRLSRVGARGLLDLAAAPAFVAWKVALMLKNQRPKEWIRTVRVRK